jgi:phage terminase Nu1 subunit (DNA packaging protein)
MIPIAKVAKEFNMPLRTLQEWCQKGIVTAQKRQKKWFMGESAIWDLEVKLEGLGKL